MRYPNSGGEHQGPTLLLYIFVLLMNWCSSSYFVDDELLVN